MRIGIWFGIRGSEVLARIVWIDTLVDYPIYGDLTGSDAVGVQFRSTLSVRGRCVMPQQTSAGSGLKLVGIALVIFGGVIYVASGGVDENPSAFLAIPFISYRILLYYRGRQHKA